MIDSNTYQINQLGHDISANFRFVDAQLIMTFQQLLNSNWTYIEGWVDMASNDILRLL